MSETTQYRESDLPLVDLRLEGGQGGEIINMAGGSRNRLMALVVSALSVGVLLDSRSTQAGQPQAYDQVNDPSIEESNALFAEEPETYVESSPSQDEIPHCDIVKGKEGVGFEGLMKDGVLQSGHNFRYEARAKVHKGKMYLCFKFPATPDHPKSHWVAKLLRGTLDKWEKGEISVTSTDLINQKCVDSEICGTL